MKSSATEQALEAAWPKIEKLFEVVERAAEDSDGLRLVRKTAVVRDEPSTSTYVVTGVEGERDPRLESIVTDDAPDTTVEVYEHQPDVVGMIDITRRMLLDRRYLDRLAADDTGRTEELAKWLRGAFEAENRLVVHFIRQRLDLVAEADMRLQLPRIDLRQVPAQARELLRDFDVIDVLLPKQYFHSPTIDTAFRKSLSGGVVATALDREMDETRFAIVLPHGPSDIVIHEAFRVRLAWELSGEAVTLITEQRYAVRVLQENPCCVRAAHVALNEVTGADWTSRCRSTSMPLYWLAVFGGDVRACPTVWHCLVGGSVAVSPGRCGEHAACRFLLAHAAESPRWVSSTSSPFELQALSSEVNVCVLPADREELGGKGGIRPMRVKGSTRT